MIEDLWRESSLATVLKDEGKAEGRAEGKAEDILAIVRERFGAAPPAVEQRVRATQDIAVLERLLIQALRVADPADLLTGLD